MKRILYYIFINLAFISRLICYRWYMDLVVMAHKSQGVKFIGAPNYIHQDAYLDPSGGLTIGDDVVISTRVIILTHDWSFLKRLKEGDKDREFNEERAYKPVVIGDNSFIGAGAIILPGSIIGCNCIIGAGSVVKGNIGDNSVVIGNPAKIIGETQR